MKNKTLETLKNLGLGIGVGALVYHIPNIRKAYNALPSDKADLARELSIGVGSGIAGYLLARMTRQTYNSGNQNNQDYEQNDQ
jgi:hypothetical protein